MKICNKECQHCQPYNDLWAVCWHRKIKGSKVQMNTECTVRKVNLNKVINMEELFEMLEQENK